MEIKRSDRERERPPVVSVYTKHSGMCGVYLKVCESGAFNMTASNLLAYTQNFFIITTNISI